MKSVDLLDFGLEICYSDLLNFGLEVCYSDLLNFDLVVCRSELCCGGSGDGEMGGGVHVVCERAEEEIPHLQRGQNEEILAERGRCAELRNRR